MDAAILNYIRRSHNFLIGERTAEELKMEAGGGGRNGGPAETRVRGRDLMTGLPRSLSIRFDEVLEALKDIVCQIGDLVRSTLESTPPELVSDIIQRGILLTGGASQIQGLDDFLTSITGVRCMRAGDPLSSVVLGAERLFRDRRLMKAIFGKDRRS